MYSGLGLAIGSELVPPGFKFPSQQEYLRSLAQGLDASKAAAGNLLQPIRVQYDALSRNIEAATGVKVSALASVPGDISNLIGARSVSAGVSAVMHLLQTGMEIAKVATEAAEAVSSAAAAIPFIGAAVSQIASIIETTTRWNPQRMDNECRIRAKDAATPWCQKALADATPIATGSNGQITPADMFRPFAYFVQQLKTTGFRPPPPNIGTMYALLCGEASGLSHIGCSGSGCAGWGIDLSAFGGYMSLATKQRMWALIQGIMGAVVPPTIGVPTGYTDQGYALFPILQNIVWEQYTKGNLTYADLQRASDEIASTNIGPQVDCTDIWMAGPGMPAVTPKFRSNCLGLIDLAKPFYDGILSFQQQLFAPDKYDPATKTWNLDSGVKRGGMRINVSLRPPPESTSAMAVKGAASGAAVAGAGWLAFELVRRFL